MKKNAPLAIVAALTVLCIEYGRPVYFGMKLIPAGSFLMGTDSSNQAEGAVNSFGDTIHRVAVSAFSIDVAQVTQSDYKTRMGVNPSHFGDSANARSRPVENVTWFDAVLYCNKRSKSQGRDTVYSFTALEGEPGNGCFELAGLRIDYSKKGYRLPTEAEWEYACRGGSTGRYWWGGDTNGLGGRVAYDTAKFTTFPVAKKPANGFGLHDMAGNVREWCNDWYGPYGSGKAEDPTGASQGGQRVLRGGSWYDNLDLFRCAYRYNYVPIHGYGRYGYFGFRCVLPR
jgi:formylglycine-generating enzyme required for sulfatase activity